MASGKPCHRLRTHFGNQNGVRHKKRGNQFIGHVISNQLRRPLIFGLPSDDDVYQYLGGLLLLEKNKLKIQAYDLKEKKIGQKCSKLLQFCLPYTIFLPFRLKRQTIIF